MKYSELKKALKETGWVENKELSTEKRVHAFINHSSNNEVILVDATQACLRGSLGTYQPRSREEAVSLLNEWKRL